MSSTSRPSPPAPGRGEYVRQVTRGRPDPARRRSGPGTDDSLPPFLLMNGIGASLEVLQPFVDALDARRTVIRFDVPGVGGSPRPVVPYVLATFTPVVAGVLDRLGFERAGRRAGAVLGRRAGAALRRAAPAPLPAAGARRNRDRHAHGAGAPARAGEDAHAAAAPGPRVRAQHRRGDLRRHDAHRTPSGPRRRCTRRRGSVRGAATTTSWPRARAGAACRSCG